VSVPVTSPGSDQEDQVEVHLLLIIQVQHQVEQEIHLQQVHHKVIMEETQHGGPNPLDANTSAGGGGGGAGAVGGTCFILVLQVIQ
jgi:hypothetical protein